MIYCQKVLMRQGLWVNLPSTRTALEALRRKHCIGSAVPVLEKEFGMSHQDKAAGIVVDHQAIKHVFDWLLRPALFVGTKVRGGAS